MERFEESDQLPEDAPSEEVVEDAGGEARGEATENPGAAEDSAPDQATGHPENAG
jgi:hypothetical protein